MLAIPEAPHSIQKGVPLSTLLDKTAVEQLAYNLHFVNPAFNKESFVREALKDIGELGIKDRAAKIGNTMKSHFPDYTTAITTIIDSLTPPLPTTDNFGLSGIFYWPHVSFIEAYGQDVAYNLGRDPFALSMKAQEEITTRNTAEFSIRAFINKQQQRTFKQLYSWVENENPHIRRLASEGSRPRLPWAQRISALITDPSPSLPILNRLKNDPDLYVRRSVANHVGDIAKDHMDLALGLCEDWLKVGTKEVNWVIRHALRNPAKKKNPEALNLRKRAK